MKTAARIFLMLSVFGSILSMLYLMWISFSVNINFSFYILLCFIPLIVGDIALRCLKKEKSKLDLVGMSICVLLFCNIIAGIIMLCMKDEDLAK